MRHRPKEVLATLDPAKVKALYDGGLTTRLLASRFGVSQDAINKYMKDHSIQARPKGKRADP